ncbi:rRNA biogenesis protein rrp5 [[Clostridium] innocuum]|nr:rRNA biogenesis protein rrp5 [[Clostridium] innocuum]MCR0502955.1 rRNA biogenesis protein rrp5 [[Clostridium] innocuum]DAY94028.1 MAG TPA: hypothetical protein [Caudoviricetes sp.]
MSRIKLLLDVIQDIRSLADSLQAVADAMTENKPEAEQKPAKKAGKSKAAKQEPTKEEPQEKPLALEDVRAVLAEKSRSGHTAAVKELLVKHGADKLSEIDPAEYPALLAEAEVL